MLKKIQWPPLQTFGLILLFSIIYGVVNMIIAGYASKAVFALNIFIYASILTAVIEWYVVSRYADAWTARRMVIANLILIGLFGLSLYLSVALPQLTETLSTYGNKDMKNPFFGFAVFIVQLKYACVLFPLRYNKKHAKH